MKVTNFEISKKLKEIGFKVDFRYCYDEEGQLWNKTFELDCWGEYDEDKYCSSFDLETLLDFLPKSINTNTCSFEEYLQLNIDQMSYQNAFSTNYICVDREENESLADVAGRLLILLCEKGIINFNK
jgi:hypothetical protein